MIARGGDNLIKGCVVMEKLEFDGLENFERTDFSEMFCQACGCSVLPLIIFTNTLFTKIQFTRDDFVVIFWLSEMNSSIQRST